jgi:predicted Zn finger-like uncharacterized protein
MPIIVPCPSCSGQLRVADDLIGHKVRCPACDITFDAREEETPALSPERKPEPGTPVETVPVAPWRNLNLELTDDRPAAEKTNGAAIKGAVEIESTPADTGPQPRTRPPREDDSRDQEDRRPRLRDDHDDLRACPSCGKMIHRESTRCYACGERLENRRPSVRRDDDDDDDFRRRRRPRRDSEPHRGGMILTFGIISAATLFVCWPLAPLALGFGIAAWWMGQGDLRKIRAGEMDPEGEGTTQAGWICGIVGVCINLLVVLACGGIIGLMWYEDIQRAKRMNRQFQNPTPKSAPRGF